MNVREKILTGIATGMMGVPWTLLILRAFDWARQSPVAERMILGYAGFMIFSGIFAEGGNFFRLPSVYPGKRSILPEAPTLTKERKIIYEIFCEADRSGSVRRHALCPCTGSR